MTYKCIPCVEGCSPHWPSALHIVAHLIVPLRKALVNFALTSSDSGATDSAAAAQETQTLVVLGKFFKELKTPLKTTKNKKKAEGSDPDEDDEEAETIDATNVCKTLEQQLKAMHLFRQEKEIKRTRARSPAKRSMSSLSLVATIEESETDELDEDPLLKSLLPKDATAAVNLVLDMIYHCTRRSLPKNSSISHTWAALLDAVGLGICAEVRTVGRRAVYKDDRSEAQRLKQKFQPYMLQRTKRETRILPCPMRISGKYESLPTGFQQYVVKRPLSRDEHNWGDEGNSGEIVAKSNHEESFDFEVKIPLLDPLPPKGSVPTLDGSPDQWSTVQTLQFKQLPAFFFLGLQRFEKETKEPETENNGNPPKLINTRVEIPLELDISKYCDIPPDPNAKSNSPPAPPTKFTLVGGILYDDGGYVAILKDPDAVSIAAASIAKKEKEAAMKTEEAAAKANDDEKNEDKSESNFDSDSDSSESSEICTWKLLESDDVIPMTEADVLEFLAGDGSEDGVLGTMLLYSTTHAGQKDRMTRLLSSLVLAGVSGDRSMFRQHHAGGGFRDIRSSLSEEVANYYYEDESETSFEEYEYIEEVISDEE